MRIRSIKPAFWSSRSICQLGRDTRLLFIGLLNYADDEGRAADDPRLVKASLFPLDDDVTPDLIETWLEELACKGRIARYQVGGLGYFEIAGFRDHQKPNKPVNSTLPPPSSATPKRKPPTTTQVVAQHKDAPLPDISGSPTVALPDSYALVSRGGEGYRKGDGVEPESPQGIPVLSGGPQKKDRPLWNALSTPASDEAARHAALEMIRAESAEMRRLTGRSAAGAPTSPGEAA